jgi:hypothetical protein
MPVQPITDIPQTHPNCKAGQDCHCHFTCPGEQKPYERKYEILYKVSSPYMKENINEDTVHPHDNKKPGSLNKQLSDVYKPVTKTESQYGPAAAAEYK